MEKNLRVDVSYILGTTLPTTTDVGKLPDQKQRDKQLNQRIQVARQLGCDTDPIPEKWIQVKVAGIDYDECTAEEAILMGWDTKKLPHVIPLETYEKMTRGEMSFRVGDITVGMAIVPETPAADEVDVAPGPTVLESAFTQAAERVARPKAPTAPMARVATNANDKPTEGETGQEPPKGQGDADRKAIEERMRKIDEFIKKSTVEVDQEIARIAALREGAEMKIAKLGADIEAAAAELLESPGHRVSADGDEDERPCDTEEEEEDGFPVWGTVLIGVGVAAGLVFGGKALYDLGVRRGQETR
jgi:hypothetical protein